MGGGIDITGTLLLCDGSQAALPALSGWELDYGAGVPCDAFQVRFPAQAGWRDILHKAWGFQAQENGARVFTGIVDEYQLILDGDGTSVLISGRGMAARLLDNEALAVDYAVATTAVILSGHVTPYGISVADAGRLSPVPLFTVASGSSEWNVLYDFARFYNGVTPRFDLYGRLILSPFPDTHVQTLDSQSPIMDVRYTEKRYGVLSSIRVRDKTTLAVATVSDEAFLSEGGRCSQVLTMPGASNDRSMRYTGQYQLERSRQERYRVEVTLAQAFWGWPGALVDVALPQADIDGIWRILESRVYLDEQGARTVLTLGARDTII